MKYLLDTDTCIYIMKKRPMAVYHRFSAKEEDEFFISSVTVGELFFGAEKSMYPEKNKVAVLVFAGAFPIVDFDSKAAAFYGKIKADLVKAGKPIGPMDYLIASIALANDLTLVTNNVREFKRIEGLKIENWVE